MQSRAVPPPTAVGTDYTSKKDELAEIRKTQESLVGARSTPPPVVPSVSRPVRMPTCDSQIQLIILSDSYHPEARLHSTDSRSSSSSKRTGERTTSRSRYVVHADFARTTWEARKPMGTSASGRSSREIRRSNFDCTGRRVVETAHLVRTTSSRQNSTGARRGCQRRCQSTLRCHASRRSVSAASSCSRCAANASSDRCARTRRG